MKAERKYVVWIDRFNGTWRSYYNGKNLNP